MCRSLVTVLAIERRVLERGYYVKHHSVGWLAALTCIGCAGSGPGVAPTARTETVSMGPRGAAHLATVRGQAARTMTGGYLFARPSHSLVVEPSGDWAFQPARRLGHKNALS